MYVKPVNVKTTLSGVLAAIAAALATPGVLPPPFGTVAQLVLALALALLGWNAKDKGLPPKEP